MTNLLLPDPGFVANAADGMSCMHACMQMVMRTKPGGTVYSFAAIDEILRRKPGLYSWGYAIHTAVSHAGFQVKSISTFSAPRFVREGEAYLLERYGEAAGRVQIANSDIPTVLEDARKFLVSAAIEISERVPTPDDIRALLAAGWYLVPLVNSKLLNSAPGYGGHFVFLYGYDDNEVIFHDPGLPPQAARKVSWDLFIAAWSSPRRETRSLTAFRADG